MNELTVREERAAREVDDNERLRKRLRLATDVTLVGSWELDPSTTLVLADARSRELFGIHASDRFSVDTLTAQVHPDDRARIADGIQQTLASGLPFLDECRAFRSKDGGLRWIAVAADAHQAPSARGPVLLGIVHDVTDRKRTEEEHARTIEELSRAVHISEMFVGILSHDLRNPLSAILGAAQLLKSDLREPKFARLLALLASSGDRMGRMIDQLLDFTRARLGEGIPLVRENVDLTQLAQGVVDEARASNLASVLRLETRGDTSGDWDRDRVCQILSNLEIVLDGSDAECVTLSVQNEGQIPLDLMPVIFNPFRGTLQKRGKSKGLGLGLYVARQIALAHGGELRVTSSGSSTAFRLELPRATRSAPISAQDFVREEELAAFERMAAPSNTSTVTAQLFGATALHDRAPLEHAELVERYGALLETALSRKAYRGQGETLTDDLKVIAERLGDLGAGPREVTEIHARALRQAVRGVTAARAQALLSEGRLLALELMGNLASYYRRRSRGGLRGPGKAG